MVKRQWLRAWMLSLIAFFAAAYADAHPAPFTYLDVRLDGAEIGVTLIAHAFDVAHDLGIDDPVRLMNSAFLAERRADIVALLNDRLKIGPAGHATIRWLELRAVPERQSLRFVGEVDAVGGALPIRARLFPYDSAHQTFVNVFENNSLTLQAILDASKPDLDYFPGSTQGVLAVARRFVPEGARHILTGSEHWLFLVGLLLLGGTRHQVALIMAAFLAAEIGTSALILSKVAQPAARLTDPALALSVVYVGADNLMVRGGRDMRPWIALAFGLLHGFWFGGALALMDLPRAALGWSLVSFSVGSTLTQAVLVLLLAAAIGTCRRTSADAARTIAVVGSVVVVIGGTFLFAQRVFFPAGLM